MCGRFSLAVPVSELAEVFGFDLPPDVAQVARWNICPTQTVAVVRVSAETGRRECVQLKWGLVPSWSKDAKNGQINARSETIAEKPSFRSAVKTRRCLIPATGFYEWKDEGGKKKVPYLVRRKDCKPYAMAGLWESWTKGPEPVESCTIITAAAGEFMTPLHDRQPVILPPECFTPWIDPATEKDAALALLQKCSYSDMEIVPADPAKVARGAA